jgi:hypothetical protein
MPTDPQPLTYAELVHKGVQVADPNGDAALSDLLDRYEDRDEVLHDPGAFRAELDEELGKLDPEMEDPALHMAGAVACELAYRQESRDAGRETLLRLAARATFEGHLPPQVKTWLDEQGVQV